jgi:hypothetical protein
MGNSADHLTEAGARTAARPGRHRVPSPRSWLTSRAWWTDAGERAIRAAAGGALGVLVGDELAILRADLRLAASAAAGADLVSRC